MTLELLGYAVGLVVVWLAAFRLPSARSRQWLYLIASWIFYYTWGSWLIVVLLFSSVMNYGLGEWLKKNITAGRLWTGILLNVTLLGFFKYLPLLGEGTRPGSPFFALQKIAFPLGVSFWTFQAISYLFELYREKELDPTLLEFCLYMSFWPTVLQGPICRMSSMLPQFRQDWRVTDDDLKTGVRRISIGTLMSLLALVMSGGLYAGMGVDAAFDNAAMRFSGIDVWCLIIAYGFQLYFSFCGFSHIVIGGARLFGIRLHENFNRPYLSTTISSFWTRWHMSMSFWIRDYVFLPLATIRFEAWWRNLALLISMFVFGIWHKGSYLLMMWGAYHGILLVLHRQWQEFRKWSGFQWSGPIAAFISWGLTFSGVCIGYIFFRAETVSQAMQMLRAIATLKTYNHLALGWSFYLMTFLASAGYFVVIGAAGVLDRLTPPSSSRSDRRVWPTLLTVFTIDRWVWIAPMVVVLTIYLSVIFHPGHAETGPVMYALF